MEEECIHNPNRDFEDFTEHLDVLFEEFESHSVKGLNCTVDVLAFPTETAAISSSPHWPCVGGYYHAGELRHGPCLGVSTRLTRLRFCKVGIDGGSPLQKLDRQWTLVVKKNIMNLPELVCTTFDFFGGGEVACFHACFRVQNDDPIFRHQ
ncbi:hypothetical protein TNCV_444791 [Trichonephila clavipes]|nr:hypothetical protein TNCV_444791 [Trichonephila clavipes]